MAGKTKSDATKALASLDEYLSRDVRARDWLRDVSKYLAKLRQEKSELSDCKESLERAVAECKASLQHYVSQCEQLTNRVNQLTASNQQLTRDVSAAMVRCEVLEKQVEARLDDPVENALQVPVAADKIFATAKVLRRRIRKAPPLHREHEQDTLGIDVESIVSSWNLEEFITLGMMCAVMPKLMGAFTIHGKRIDDCPNDSQLGGMVRWLSGWMALGDEEVFMESLDCSHTQNPSAPRMIRGTVGRFHRTKSSHIDTIMYGEDDE